MEVIKLVGQMISRNFGYLDLSIKTMLFFCISNFFLLNCKFFCFCRFFCICWFFSFLLLQTIRLLIVAYLFTEWERSAELKMTQEVWQEPWGTGGVVWDNSWGRGSASAGALGPEEPPLVVHQAAERGDLPIPPAAFQWRSSQAASWLPLTFPDYSFIGFFTKMPQLVQYSSV